MPRRPRDLPEGPPGAHALEADALDELLRVLRLRARVFLHARLCGRWRLGGGRVRRLGFHAVASGRCLLHLADRRAPVRLGPGAVALLVPAVDHHLAADAGRGEAEIVCGHFEFARRDWNPLVEDLPPLLVLQERPGPGGLVALIASEAASGAPGAGAVAERLAEALFVRMVREHARRTATSAGFAAALADPHVGRALRALHREPARAWTLAQLAREAGLSRSAFAQRFRARVGETPMAYLRRWRMAQAHELLADGTWSVAQAAAACGYASEAAFARAFKRAHGMGPGAVRRARPRRLVSTHRHAAEAEF